MVRLFNFKGVETKFFCLDRPLVTAVGYENLLAIVYHESPPFMKCQCLKLKVIDIEKEKVIYNDGCPISPNTTLNWFGFSESGMIFTQDSRGIIRGLPAFKQWHVLYKPKDDKKHSRFWMIGVHEYNFIGCVLEKDELEPSTYSRPPVKSMKIHTPFLDENNYYAPKNAEIIKKNIILDHERYRSENWLELKLSREKSDNFFSYSENILDKHEIQGASDNVEKSVVELFQECLANQDLEKAYILATYLKTVKSLNICLYICNKANMMNLAPKIQSLLDVIKILSSNI
jgi:chromosome transmission fidelity protein 4